MTRKATKTPKEPKWKTIKAAKLKVHDTIKIDRGGRETAQVQAIEQPELMRMVVRYDNLRHHFSPREKVEVFR